MSFPKIYYFCPSWKHETYGGLKKIYQHVEMLQELGFAAFVLHDEKGFKLDWFAHQASIVYCEEVELSATDIVVIPETFAFKERLYPNNRFVIFNQGAYLTFLSLDTPKKRFSAQKERKYPYFDPKCLGTIVVSKDSAEYLQGAFPGIALYRVRLSIDYQLFAYQNEKKKQIAYMTRKRPEDVVQVVSLLIGRGKLKDWKAVPIQRESEENVAKILRESAIFLNFSVEEGWGLPAHEAMACGCEVIGYHGQGGKEFIREPYAHPITLYDIISFVSKIEEVALNYQPKTEASEFVKREYSRENEKIDLQKAWEAFLYNNERT